MKFTCNRDSLINGINIVSKAVSNRTTLPILQCILIKVANEGFKLIANDLEIGIETGTIDADVEIEGTVAVEAKIFSDIVKKLNGSEIMVSCDIKNAITISCGMSKYNIMGQNGDEFPEITKIEQNNPYTLKQKVFKDMINKTIFSIAPDESKPVLTGELVEINDSDINMVAVDGYRISYKKASIDISGDSNKVIIPGKTLREISRILGDGDEIVSIYITENHISFEFNGNIVVSRLLEGEFIKYEQTFSQGFKTKVVAKTSELVSCLERASLISRDARKVPVKIEIKDNKFIIDSSTEVGSAHEEAFVETEGENLNIAFNPKYLIDALKVIEDDEICLLFNSSLSPCIIKPLEGDGYKYLVLPLRM